MDTATVSSTPSGTTETSTAAPATGALPSSVTPGQRPTFEQAFAADTAPDSLESPASLDAPTTQAAETPAPESAIHPSTDKGPPQEKWPAILDNARVKAKAEAQAEFDRDFGWMRGAPQEQWVRMAEIGREMSNPPEFLEKYFAEAANDPTHGAAVRSWAARTLASRAPKQVDLSPDVTVQDDQGREVARTFSADRVQAIVQQAVQDAIGKEIAPLKQDHAQRQAQEQRQAVERRQAETHKQLEASADAVLADLADLLDVTAETPPDQAKALYDEVEALLTADPSLSPHKAAMQVRKTRIVPKLQGNAQKSVLDDLNKRAAAQGMNPAGAAIAPTHRPRSFNDPALKWD